jgi:hypothetical protein
VVEEKPEMVSELVGNNCFGIKFSMMSDIFMITLFTGGASFVRQAKVSIDTSDN